MPQARPVRAKKPERLEARIAPEKKRLIERAAELEGLSMTDFMVSKLGAAAIETIRDFETLRLQDESRAVFVAALLSPPEPNEAAKRAVALYKEQMTL